MLGVFLLVAAALIARQGTSPGVTHSAGAKRGAYQAGDGGRPVRLLKRDGSPIRRSEIPALYGKPDGVTVLADGADVTSPAYAASKGIRPLAPRGWDLSDEAGWPETPVPPGVLAIDPRRGRVKFSAGDSRPPVTVGRLHTGFGVPGAGRPVILGRYAVVPAGEGDLTVMDLSDPAKPRLAAFIPTDFFYSKVHRFRDSLFLDARRGRKYAGLAWVRDFSDPARPGKAAMVRWRDVWGWGIRGVIEDAGLAYATSGDRVFVLDISNPERIRERNRVRLKGLKAFHLAPGRRFAVAVLDGGRTLGLVSLRDPLKPVLAATLPNLPVPRPAVRFRWGTPPPYAEVMEVWDEGFALRVGFWDLAVYRVSAGTRGPGGFTVKDTGWFSFGEGKAVIRDVLHRRSRLYVADGRRTGAQRSLYRGFKPSRLFTIDLRAPGGPAVVDTYIDPGITEYSNLGVMGDTLLVNDYNFGLWTFDISRPGRPVKLGGHPTAAEGRFAHVSGDRAYIAHTFGGTIVAVDVSDPRKPKRLGYYWDGVWMNYMARMAGRDGFLYVPKNHELTIVDFRDPKNPKRLGEFRDESGLPLGDPFIVVSGGVAFVASVQPKTGASALRSYDLTNPGRPTLMAYTPLLTKERQPWRMALSAGRLYLAAARGGRLWIYDVEDPADLRPLGRFDGTWVRHKGRFLRFDRPRGVRNGGIAVAKGYAYVTLGGYSPKEPSIYVFDVRDPSEPKFASVIEFPEKGWQYFYTDVSVYGGYLIGAEYGRLHIYSLKRPDRPRLIHTFTRTGEGSFFGRGPKSYQWTIGGFRENLMFIPKLDGLDVIRIPTRPEYPEGKVEIRARY